MFYEINHGDLGRYNLIKNDFKFFKIYTKEWKMFLMVAQKRRNVWKDKFMELDTITPKKQN